MNNNYLKNLKSDIPAGLVVFLVALPLCLGIASASGSSPDTFSLVAGIIAGIVGGIVVGFFSGSQVGASGPAAGLAVIVFTSVNDIGFQPFLLAVMIGGLLQIIMGFLKAGMIAYYFPNSVIRGMLASIGIILILKQIPHALGYDRDQEGDASFFQADGENTFSEIFQALDYFSIGAVIISVTCLIVLILWDKYLTPKGGVMKMLPGALIVVTLGAVLNRVLGMIDPALSVSAEHLVQIPKISSFSGLSEFVTFPDWSSVYNPAVWITGFTIAIVASLETLLCVEATDKLDPHKRITPANLELKAQGIGNMISGLIGGLPITQVIVRSSANIDAGGQTKVSTIFHGVLLLVSVVFIPGLLSQIPLAALAAILLVVGYKLAKISVFKDMLSKGKEQYIPFLVTVFAIILSDLLIGIGIGFLVAIFFILQRNLETDHVKIKEEDDGKHTHRIILSEEVSFLNKGALQDALEHVKHDEEVIIDGTKAVSIPYDIFDLIKEFESTAHERNITVFMKGFTKDKVN